jgi:hypothetical protein
MFRLLRFCRRSTSSAYSDPHSPPSLWLPSLAAGLVSRSRGRTSSPEVWRRGAGKAPEVRLSCSHFCGQLGHDHLRPFTASLTRLGRSRARSFRVSRRGGAWNGQQIVPLPRTVRADGDAHRTARDAVPCVAVPAEDLVTSGRVPGTVDTKRWALDHCAVKCRERSHQRGDKAKWQHSAATSTSGVRPG